MGILSLAIMQRAPMQILWLILVSLKKVHAICKHCQSFAFERDFEIKAHLDVYCSELVFQNSRTFSCLDFIFRSWYKCLGSRMVYPEWQDIKELKKLISCTRCNPSCWLFFFFFWGQDLIMCRTIRHIPLTETSKKRKILQNCIFL